jgi:hypothetical protein
MRELPVALLTGGLLSAALRFLHCVFWFRRFLAGTGLGLPAG